MTEELAKARLELVTLESLAEDARPLGEHGLASRIAPGFLVCLADSPLVVPEGPVETQRVDLRQLHAAQAHDVVPQSPVFALARKPGSVYRFLSVGRTRNCDLVVPDESVSKLHALIREEQGVLSVEDAGSRNGTFVDHARAPRRGEGEPLLLRAGSRVRFGSVETRYYAAADLYALVRKVVG